MGQRLLLLSFSHLLAKVVRVTSGVTATCVYVRVCFQKPSFHNNIIPVELGMHWWLAGCPDHV